MMLAPAVNWLSFSIPGEQIYSEDIMLPEFKMHIEKTQTRNDKRISTGDIRSTVENKNTYLHRCNGGADNSCIG